MDSRSSAIFVNFGPGVSPLGQKLKNRSHVRQSLARCDKRGWTAADRVSCEKEATAWSVTASVVNYLCFAVISDWHVGIYASPDNWHTC